MMTFDQAMGIVDQCRQQFQADGKSHDVLRDALDSLRYARNELESQVRTANQRAERAEEERGKLKEENKTLQKGVNTEIIFSKAHRAAERQI